MIFEGTSLYEADGLSVADGTTTTSEDHRSTEQFR